MHFISLNIVRKMCHLLSMSDNSSILFLLVEKILLLTCISLLSGYISVVDILFLKIGSLGY